MRAGDTVAGDAVRRLAGDVLSLECDAAAIGRIDAVDAIEHGRLAGAVGADEAKDLAVVHGEVQAAHGLHAAKALADADNFEQGRHSSSLRIRGQRR